jgi:hypothetical protein
MKNDLLEIITNSYLVHNNIRNAYLFQTKDTHKLIKLYPDLQISDNYTPYQGPLISKSNYNNQTISHEKMGKILEYPCVKDFNKIKGDSRYIIYKLIAVINNNEILLIVNKCLHNHKDKFMKMKTLYNKSLKLKEYSDIINSICNIKVKTINVKLEIEEISSLNDLIYKSICNIRFNIANKNNLLIHQVHKHRGYSKKDALKLINSNEVFIRTTIKNRAINAVHTLNKQSVLAILQNKKLILLIVRNLNIPLILRNIFI